MRLVLTERFRQSYADAPKLIQKATDKQLRLLLQNLKHPSLHAKKYNESQDIWQARITRDWRCYFLIEQDAYVLLKLSSHPK